MKTGLQWLIYGFIWIVILVVVPTAAIGGYILALNWFVLLPTDLKEEIKSRWKKDEERRKRCRRTDGGVFSFFLFIGVCIKVYLDDNWSTQFRNLDLGYFVGAFITVFIWILIIFGIPAVIFGFTWFIKKYGVSE